SGCLPVDLLLSSEYDGPMGRSRSAEAQQPPRGPGRFVGALAAAAAAALALAPGASAPAAGATTVPASTLHAHRVCGMPRPGAAACMAIRLVPTAATAGEVQPGAAMGVGAAAAGARGAAVAAKGSPNLTPESLHA